MFTSQPLCFHLKGQGFCLIMQLKSKLMGFLDQAEVSQFYGFFYWVMSSFALYIEYPSLLHGKLGHITKCMQQL